MGKVISEISLGGIFWRVGETIYGNKVNQIAILQFASLGDSTFLSIGSPPVEDSTRTYAHLSEQTIMINRKVVDMLLAILSDEGIAKLREEELAQKAIEEKYQ